MTEVPLPLPPVEMRALVGPTEESAFDNPGGAPVFPDLPVELSDSVFDLGCGCGRLARQFLQQEPRPQRYVGLDLHAGMIRWDSQHLTPVDEHFTFIHHDVYQVGFNPNGRPLDHSQPLPVADASASLVIAWSVFTHLLEEDIPFYLRECVRILRPGGVIRSTWFLFDKRFFPMMQTFQNALYINHGDPTNAVIVDRAWLLGQLAAFGLEISAVEPVAFKGHQWIVDLRHAGSGPTAVLPETDERPFGSIPSPVGGETLAHEIGVDD